jgi:hypothetical protein
MFELSEILPIVAIDKLRPVDPMPELEWLRQIGFTIDGRPFDLSRVPYQRQIYEDQRPYQVFQKGSQVGISSRSLAKVLWGADQLGMRWIYFLPTDDESDDFVADRVEGVIRNSEYLMDRVGRTDNRGLKTIGPGLNYYRGLWTKRRAKSVPADGLVFDEVDEHKPEMIAFGEDRVLASDWQWRIYLSVPSFSDIGINALFNETDQRYYHIRCGCGHWNCLDLDFPENFIDVGTDRAKSWPAGATHYVGCAKCAGGLDVAAGEWIAKYPDRLKAGYIISRLYSPSYPPHYPNAATFLMEEYAESLKSQTRAERFTIAFRGLPFDGAGARITDELLDSLEGEDGFIYSSRGCVIGIDQGDTLHITVCGFAGKDRLQLIYCEATSDWTRLDHLMKRYGAAMAGCDGNPNRDNAKAFVAKHPKHAFIQDFTGKDLQDKESLFRGKQPVRWVTVDRTESLDATVDFLESGRLILPDKRRLSGADKSHYEEWRRHVKNLKSKIEDTPRGKQKMYLRGVPNHQGMALNTARIAAFELGMRRPVTGVAPVFMGWGNA